MRARGSFVTRDLFNNEALITIDEVGKTKGRSQELVNDRNEHLLHRFAFYKLENKYAYDWIMRSLAKEFYLTEVTIGDIITANLSELKAIKEAGTTVGEMAKRWPWMKW